MKTELFNFELPIEYIAQSPAQKRTDSKLMVLHRDTGKIEHKKFTDLKSYLTTKDLIVVNNSKVIPARLQGQKSTGGRVEVFLLKPLDNTSKIWECLTRGTNIKEGTKIALEKSSSSQTKKKQINATITATNANGTRIIEFETSLTGILYELGELPLPPYITQYKGHKDRYQTVYSEINGSVAAPTAGLHFSEDYINELKGFGVNFESVTLHVGLGTFKPVESENIEEHKIHSEWAELSQATCDAINMSHQNKGRVLAVGTTSVRTLESAQQEQGNIEPFSKDVDLYITPGFKFNTVDMMLTNFHLPKSSLLMLVSAFINDGNEDLDWGRKTLLSAYEEAKKNNYRFYSFGDAMLIL